VNERLILIRQRTVPSYSAISLPTKIAMHERQHEATNGIGEIHAYRHINRDRVEDQRPIISRLAINIRGGGSPELGNRGPEEYGKAANVSM
jgi:hypothetical protein